MNKKDLEGRVQDNSRIIATRKYLSYEHDRQFCTVAIQRIDVAPDGDGQREGQAFSFVLKERRDLDRWRGEHCKTQGPERANAEVQRIIGVWGRARKPLG